MQDIVFNNIIIKWNNYFFNCKNTISYIEKNILKVKLLLFFFCLFFYFFIFLFYGCPSTSCSVGTNGCLVCIVRCHHMSCSWPIMHNKKEREREREENKEKKASLAPRQEPDPIVHFKAPVLRDVLFQTDTPLSHGVQLPTVPVTLDWAICLRLGWTSHVSSSS